MLNCEDHRPDGAKPSRAAFAPSVERTNEGAPAHWRLKEIAD